MSTPTRAQEGPSVAGMPCQPFSGPPQEAQESKEHQLRPRPCRMNCFPARASRDDEWANGLDGCRSLPTPAADKKRWVGLVGPPLHPPPPSRRGGGVAAARRRDTPVHGSRANSGGDDQKGGAKRALQSTLHSSRRRRRLPACMSACHGVVPRLWFPVEGIQGCPHASQPDPHPSVAERKQASETPAQQRTAGFCEREGGRSRSLLILRCIYPPFAMRPTTLVVSPSSQELTRTRRACCSRVYPGSLMLMLPGMLVVKSPRTQSVSCRAIPGLRQSR